jgi:hypothetical protein
MYILPFGTTMGVVVPFILCMIVWHRRRLRRRRQNLNGGGNATAATSPSAVAACNHRMLQQDPEKKRQIQNVVTKARSVSQVELIPALNASAPSSAAAIRSGVMYPRSSVCLDQSAVTVHVPDSPEADEESGRHDASHVQLEGHQLHFTLQRSFCYFLLQVEGCYGSEHLHLLNDAQALDSIAGCVHNDAVRTVYNKHLSFEREGISFLRRRASQRRTNITIHSSHRRRHSLLVVHASDSVSVVPPRLNIRIHVTRSVRRRRS